jgi:hypothetical protein
MKIKNFTRQIFEKWTKIKFQDIPSSWRPYVPRGKTEGRTDVTELSLFAILRTRLPTRHFAYYSNTWCISQHKQPIPPYQHWQAVSYVDAVFVYCKERNTFVSTASVNLWLQTSRTHLRHRLLVVCKGLGWSQPSNQAECTSVVSYIKTRDPLLNICTAK